MGCGHARSTEEQLITDFWDSLPIRNTEPEVVAAFIAESKKGSNNKDEDAINKIQDKFFKSNETSFKNVRIFEEFYKANKTKSKFVFWCPLMLAKLNHGNTEKFKAGSVQILEEFKHKQHDTFGLEWKCDEGLLKGMLEAYIEMISSFSLIHLAELAEKPKSFNEKLTPPFSKHEQHEYIKRNVKGENNQVDINLFLKTIEVFDDCLVRDKMVESHKIKEDARKREENESKTKTTVDVSLKA